MKQKLLAIVLSVTLFSLHFGAAQNTPGVKWIAKNPFEQKVFVENIGQFQLPGKAAAKDILFYARQDGLQYYFTPTGILISRIVSVKRPEEEIEQLKLREGGKKTGDDDDELEFKNIEQFYEMNFEGADSHDTITGDNEVSWYYSYTIKGDLAIKAHAWKKLTYHNLYPGIDMEFYFPEDKEGFEYSFIVHPDADISQIKIQYNGDIKLNSDGNMTITSPYGNFMQYAPVSKLSSSNKEIKCDFSLSNGSVKFTADAYDKSETLLIDPLIITPTFNRTNDAYDLDWDDAGNIYVYGGSYPWQILKYNSAGTLLWSYTTIFNGNNQYLGDFAVDRHSQSVYVTEGRDATPSGALAFKLNSSGVLIAQYGGNVDFNEMWKIAFSSCTNQAVIAGGGSTTPSYTASYLDTNLTSLSLVNTLNDTVSGFHDMWDLALDNFGNSYMVTAHSVYSTLDPDSFNNVLLKLPLPTLIPTTWMVHSNYDVLEHGSLTYGLDDAFQPGNGYNGMTVSDTTLYTYDSYVLKQWGTTAGNILDSVFVNGPSEDSTISWGGLTSDDCGHIFLGSINTVQQYNSSLNLVQTFAEPDTVYDVRLSNKDMLYACGIGFISATQLNLPSCYIIKVTNNIKNVDCDTLGSATVIPTGGTPPYTITWNTIPLQTGNTATGLYAGTYIATIYDSSCIVQTFLDTVTILTNAIQITPNNATICDGNSATLSASGAVSTYSWSPSTGLSSTSGSSVIASPTVTTTYTVIGTSAAGCTDTVQSVVTVNPTPVIAVTNPQSICIGSSTTLAASGATTYTWAPSIGLSDSTGSSVTANPTITTTYTITGTDSIGCTATTTVIVTVNPNPTITVATPAPICTGSSTTLTANGAATYTWTPVTGLSATTGASVIASPASSTAYTITGTDGNGCTGTTTVAVAVNPNPTITVATPAPICNGSSTTLTANGAATYTWAPVTGLSATTGSSVTADPTTTTLYTVIGTDGNGCIGTTTVAVTVNPNPTITVATPAPICSGNSTTLTANGATTYSWSPSTGLSATTGSTVAANPTTTTIYTITGVDGNGCTATTTVTVTVNPNPAITVATPAPICSGSSVTLIANGAVTYIWSPSTGLSATTGSSVTANPITTAIYAITGTDVNGCTGITTVVVTVNPNPIITVATPAPICNGSSTTLTANGATTYTWSPSTGLSATTGSSVTANPTITTIYTVNGIDADGCQGSTMVNVIINPKPILNVPTPPTICNGSTAILTASGANIYTWTPAIGLSSTTGSSITANPTITTTYTVSGIDVNGCMDTTTVTVTVSPTLVIGVTTPTPICVGSSTILTATGANTYTWTPATGLSATTGAAVIANPTVTTAYTITGMSLNDCTGTATVTVTVNPNPSLIINTPAPICSGTSTSLIVNGASTYTWTPATGLSTTTGSSVTANPVTTTTYTITGTDGNGCTGITTVTVTVNPNPTIIVATPAPICNGTNTLLTASGATTYTWSPSTGLNATTGSSVSANPTTTTTYIITGTDGNGCTGTTTVTFTVNPNPIVTVATPAPICNGSSTTLTANGATTYTWSPSTGLNATTGSTVTANPTATTIYTIAGTDINGCTGTTTVTLIVNPNPTVMVATPAPICNGSSTTLTAGGATTYSWSPSAGLSSTTGSLITANPTTTTTYTITGTDGNGCTATTTMVVTVNPNPTITAATPAPICNGSSTTLTANGAINYTWSPSTGLSASTGSSVTANPATTTTYTITGTDANGCSATTTVTITVNPNPTITVAAPAPICSGNSTTLTANGAVFYSWTPSIGLNATSGSSIIANPATTTTYTISGIDVNGCTNTITALVTVNPNLIVTVDTPAPICSGSSATLTANGAATYSWTPSTGLNETTGSSVIATPTITSTYTITGTSGVGCSSVTTVVVTVNPNPIITVTTPAPICNGTTTTLAANGAAMYSWLPATGLSATTGSLVTANPTTTTTYTVTGTDVNGCIATTTVTVTVNPNPIVTVVTPAPICNGTSTTLIANGAATYSWSPSTGLSVTTGSLVTAGTTTTTTYTVTGTDANGCTATSAVIVTINPNPIVTVANPAPICNGSTTTLTANGVGNYSWSPSTGLSATTGSLVTANPTITTTYAVTGTDVNGCTATTAVTVTVNPNPIVTVATPAPICNGSTTTLTANGAITYNWTPATGLSTTAGSSITANPTTTTTYTAMGTDVNGCTGATTVTVTVNPNPTITVTTPALICNGTTTTLTVNGAVKYIWTPATGLSATTGSSVTAGPTTTTTYTITGTDGNGCIATTTVTVTVNPNPTITVAAPAPICSGSSTTLTANGAITYTWTPATGLNATTGSSITANPTTTSTYTVTGTDVIGCTATNTVTVTVNLNLSITVTTPAPICNGTSTLLTANGAATYIWTPSTGLNATTGSSVTANPIITTPYSITGIDVNGCTVTATVTVTVNPNPTLIVVPPTPICNGSSTILSASYGGASYTWTPSLGLSTTTGSSVTANPTTSTTYTITELNVSGCSATTTVAVTVNPMPTIAVSTPVPICNGSSTILSATGALSYTWTPAIGLSNSIGFSVTAYSTITTTYTITGTDSNDCTGTTKVVVKVNPNPIITATTPTPMCSGRSATLKANGATTYIWTPSAGLSNTTGSMVTANPTVTTTYSVIGTDGNGCNSTTKVDVSIYPLPTIMVDIPPAFCKGDSATLIAQGATSYSWTPSTGLNATSGSSVLSKPANTVTYTVTGVGANGCIGTDEVSVIVNPNPTVSANTPPGICRGNSQKLIVSGAINYSWSPSAGLNVTTGSSVIANPTTSTTYTVIGINDAGCAGEAQVQLLVMPLPDVSLFGLNPIYCTNSSPVTLIGNPKGGTFSGSGIDSNQFNPALTGVGTYLIKYIYTDSNGCEDSSTTTITVDPLPKVIVNPNNPTVCSGIPTTLNAMGADNYLWRPGTGLSDSTGSNVTADPTVTTTYIVTGINSDSCFDTAMVTIYVDSTPTASFNTQISNYCEPMTMQFNNTSDDGIYYSWDFGDGTTSSEFNPQHTYKQGGIYQVILTVTSQFGCMNDTVKEVVIKQSFDDLVQIGNAFTPGVDGINNIITPHVLCTDLSGYVFRVYNRWGQLLFQTYDPNAGWDGRFNGQIQLVGVYDYYIEFNCDDCKIFKKGNITLLK